MNPSTHFALVNEVSDGSGNRRISLKSETYAGSAGNHSIGVLPHLGSHRRSKGRVTNRLSEGEAAKKALRNSVFFKGRVR